MVMASWCAARFTGPWAVTTSTVARIAIRRLRVRSISQEPTLVSDRMPRQSGSRDTPWLRALRRTITTYTSGHGPLRDAGADGGARHGPVQPVDQDEVQHDVQREAGGGDDQRRAGVLQAPQHTGAREDQQHRHESGHGPAQVVDGERPHLAAGTHQLQEGFGGRKPAAASSDPEQKGQPDAVAPGGEGLGQLAVAHRPSHCRRRGVREEHHQPYCRMQHRGGQPDAGQLGYAEVADDCRIGEQEQRLGDQGTEGRDGEAKDLAAAGRGRQRGGGRRQGGHGTTLAAGAAGAPQCANQLVDFSTNYLEDLM